MITKEKKKKILEELAEKISRQKSIVFADITKLKTKDLYVLRKRVKEGRGEAKVVKKTLLRLALEKHGIKIDEEKLIGQILAIFGYEDEVLPAKVAFEFSKTNENFKIKGGIIQNQFLEKEKIEEIAKLPTKEELLARIVSQISAPISNFVYLLNGVLQNFVFVLHQIQLKVQK